ncbi:hypothetical protein [Vibrio owensii]|nr:hypothetical protein [Vibrio owensii]
MHKDDYVYDSFDEELLYDMCEENDTFESDDSEFDIDDLHNVDE